MAVLLDAYGRPVRRQDLSQPLAQGGTTGVRQVFAASLASGLTPVRLAQILRACDDGQITDFAVLAEEMEERDPHYASVLGVRKRAVSGVAPTVTPGSEEPGDMKIAEAVRTEIAGHDGFADLVEDLLDGLGKGFSVVEIGWTATAARWTPERFDWRPQRFLTFDRETGEVLRLIDEANPTEGIPLAPFKFLVHSPRLKSGHVARSGIARLVAFNWMCKAYTLKDWMTFAETYGQPLRIGRYGPGASREDVEKLFTAVANIGTDAAAVLPDSMRIEFESVSGTQSEAVFENLCRYLDEQVSKAVLGQTMTSDNGSSQAQATVHNEVRHDIAASDARAVTNTLNRDLVKPFVDLNFGPKIHYPRLVISVDVPEDLDMVLKHTAELAGKGMRFKAAEVRAKLRYGDPEPEDEVFGGASSAPAPPAPVPAQNALARNSETAPPDPFAVLDEIEAEMLAGWQPVMDETLAPILKVISEAGSLEEVKTLLAGLETLPAAKLIETLVKGGLKARSIGDVRDA